ncbi:MAG: high frequency lysogenization protein HflD [Gammaproteobacteria bacterium]|nr:high frequency lysogenization protein HflD [Gammaproteobacteria bacterium]MCP5424355.1 high frequency lysogenization protein HflD [Gammaproteobacteria bacterium]MCP5459106.1 high frequency lysogenization protein HflD [Gammaproteobacteria bacterium]
MPQTDHDRMIALAGLLLASNLVRDIARQGQTDPDDFETCLASLLKINASSSDEIYGGLRRLRSALNLVARHLRNPSDLEVTRYLVVLLVLERKLVKRPVLLKSIREGIEATVEKLNFFPLTHNNIIASLAEIYATTISTLSPRIMVNGERVYLADPDNANRIRALLLAGIRAARLWRQSGGGRLTLLFRRKALLLETQRALAALEP